MKVDYHVHTLCSDGIHTVEEVVALVQQNGIQAFSVTDHDTIAGIALARKQLYSLEHPPRFVAGLEITCQEIRLPGVSIPFSIHLLGYGFDETNTSFLARLHKRNLEAKKVFISLAQELTSLGFPTDIHDVPISCGNVMQLCDFSTYIEHTYRPNDSRPFALIDSFSDMLTKANILPLESIDLIHQAGGKAVWAHPFHVYHAFRKRSISCGEVKLIFDHLLQNGLDALEADYLSFDATEQEWLRNLALSSGCFYTAGSDFHGSPSRNIMGVESETAL